MLVLWDEIECVRSFRDEDDPDLVVDQGWELEHTYPNGVRLFRSERGHAALEYTIPGRVPVAPNGERDIEAILILLREATIAFQVDPTFLRRMSE